MTRYDLPPFIHDLRLDISDGESRLSTRVRDDVSLLFFVHRGSFDESESESEIRSRRDPTRMARSLVRSSAVT